jgi:hypothetical protein
VYTLVFKTFKMIRIFSYLRSSYSSAVFIHFVHILSCLFILLLIFRHSLPPSFTLPAICDSSLAPKDNKQFVTQSETCTFVH